MTRPADISSALSELCRRDFQVFVERVFATLDPAAELERAPYLEILSNYLARTERGEMRRLLITISPRHLKSIATEPPRVCRRLQLLRRWSLYEQDDEQVCA